MDFIALIEQNGVVLGLFAYVTGIFGLIAWFVTRTIGSLANKQQAEGERKDQLIAEMVARLTIVEKQLSHEEGASQTLKKMLDEEREFQRNRDDQWQIERTAMRERLADLERQLNEQQKTINELKQHNKSKAGEITTLQETNTALQEINTRLQKAHDSLVAQNESLEDALDKKTKHLELLDNERKRSVERVQALATTVQELTRKLADCEAQEQEQATTETSDDSQEDNIAA